MLCGLSGLICPKQLVVDQPKQFRTLDGGQLIFIPKDAEQKGLAWKGSAEFSGKFTGKRDAVLIVSLLTNCSTIKIKEE